MNEPAEHSILRAPIPGENPTGLDLSYDSDFARLREEIDKLSSLTGLRPDWSAVQRGCSRLLSDRSKDLRLLAWLAAAKLHSDGLAGFRSGLIALRTVSETYWEPMHPSKRERARGKLMDWLWQHAAAVITARDFGPDDAEAVGALEEECQRVDALFSARLGELYRGTRELRDALDQARQSGIPVVEPTAGASPDNEAALTMSIDIPSMDVPHADVGEPEWIAGVRAAMDPTVNGDVGKKLALAYDLAIRGRDGRERFLAKLEVARLALSAGEPRTAEFLLEALLTEAREHRLESWEPKLIVSLYTTLFACLAAAEDKDEIRARKRDVIARIGGLDPAAAMRLSKSSA